MALKSKRVDALLYPKNASQSSSSTSPFTTAEQKRARENIGAAGSGDVANVTVASDPEDTNTTVSVREVEPSQADPRKKFYLSVPDLGPVEFWRGTTSSNTEKKAVVSESFNIPVPNDTISLPTANSNPSITVVTPSSPSENPSQWSILTGVYGYTAQLEISVTSVSDAFLELAVLDVGGKVNNITVDCGYVHKETFAITGMIRNTSSSAAISGFSATCVSTFENVSVRLSEVFIFKIFASQRHISGTGIADVTVGGTSVVDEEDNIAKIPALPEVPVQDVTVNGHSVLNTTTGTAEIPEITPGIRYLLIGDYVGETENKYILDMSRPDGNGSFENARTTDIISYRNRGDLIVLIDRYSGEDNFFYAKIFNKSTTTVDGVEVPTIELDCFSLQPYSDGRIYETILVLSSCYDNALNGIVLYYSNWSNLYRIDGVPDYSEATAGQILKVTGSGSYKYLEWGDAQASASTHFFLIPDPPASDDDPWYVLDMSKPVENPNEGDPEYEQALVEDIVEYLSNKEEVVFVAVDNMNRYLPVQSFSISGSQDEEVIIVCTNIDADNGDLALIQKGVVVSEEDGNDGYTGYLIVDRENTIFAEVEGLPGHTSGDAGKVLCLDSDGIPQWKKHTKIHLLLGYFNQYLYDTEKDSETEPYCEKITLNDLIDMYEAGETFVLRYGNASSGDYYALRRLQYSSSHDTELIFDQIVFDYGPDKQTPSLYHSAKVLSISYTEEYTETEVNGETVREYTGYLKEHYNQTFNLQEKLSIGAESGLIMGADGKSLSVDKDSIEVQVSKEIDDAVKTVKSHVIYTFSPAAINSRITNIKSDQSPANNQCQPTAFCTVLSPSMNMELSTDTSIVFFTTSNAASDSAASAPAYIVIEQIGLNEGSLKWVANSGNIADQLKTAGKQVVKLLDIDQDGGKNVSLSSDCLYYVCLVISSGNDIQPVGIQASQLGLDPSTYRRVQFDTQAPPDHTAMRTFFPSVCTGSSFGSEVRSPIFFAITNMAVDTGGATITRDPPFDTISGYTLTKKAISTFYDSDPSDILQKITPTANCTLKSWSVIDSQSSVSDASMLGKIFAWIGANPTEVHTHGSGGQSTGGSVSTTALSGSEAGYYKHTYTPSSDISLTGGQEYQFPVTTALGNNRSNVIVQYSGGFTRDLVFWRYGTGNEVRTFGAYLEVTVEYNGQTITGVV